MLLIPQTAGRVPDGRQGGQAPRFRARLCLGTTDRSPKDGMPRMHRWSDWCRPAFYRRNAEASHESRIPRSALHAGGFTLVEMLVFTLLLGVFMVITAQLFTVTNHAQQDAEKTRYALSSP